MRSELRIEPCGCGVEFSAEYAVEISKAVSVSGVLCLTRSDRAAVERMGILDYWWYCFWKTMAKQGLNTGEKKPSQEARER